MSARAAGDSSSVLFCVQPKRTGNGGWKRRTRTGDAFLITCVRFHSCSCAPEKHFIHPAAPRGATKPFCPLRKGAGPTLPNKEVGSGLRSIWDAGDSERALELGPRVVRQERRLSVGKQGERWSSRGSPATSCSTIQPSGRVPTGWAAPLAVCHSGSPGGEQPPVDAPPLSRRDRDVDWICAH